MRRTAMLAVAALSLAACSGDDGEPAASTPDLPEKSASTSASAEPSAAEPSRSQRGNLVKALGEDGGVCGPADDPCTEEALVLKFAVDSITPGVDCNSGFASPPDNGNFIGVDVRVSTTPEYPADQYFVTFTAADFSVIGPDGLTVSDVQGQASSCLGPNGFTYDPIGPGQQYAGTVVIDSPVTSGTLVYAPAGETTGWEWQF